MKFYIIIIFIFLYFLKNYYYKHIEYYKQICKYRKIKDLTRWLLCDKFIAKEYGKILGLNCATSYQIVKYPHNIDFKKLPDSYVIKPLDLCDSAGIYFIKNNIDLKTNKTVNQKKIIFELTKLRATIGNEYYMHDLMFNGSIPIKGYIVEELLLDNGAIPQDYKFYTFNGKVYFIAITYNRKIINGKQYFDSLWLTRDWKPIRIKMIKEGYKFSSNIKKPKNYKNLIYKIEEISKILNRHCRIDIYYINEKIYIGEFTFFCGAFLHTFLCNLILGTIWLFNKDNYDTHDKRLLRIIN